MHYYSRAQSFCAHATTFTTYLTLLTALLAPSLSAGTIITLASSTGNLGATLTSSVIADSAGNLYGTTEGDLLSTFGTVFELPAGSHTLTTIGTFHNTNGANPSGGLVFDKAGNLYGTTEYNGTIFKIAAGTHVQTTVAAIGDFPESGLTLDSQGNLYGTTYGEFGGLGTVYKIAANTNLYTMIAAFNTSLNGQHPQFRVFVDKAGNIFGTTEGDQINTAGSIFKIAAGTNSAVALHTFPLHGGVSPSSGLIADSNGNLYGTTGSGGANDDGTIYKISPVTGVLTTLASFDGTNGRAPGGGLLFDALGNLYGTTGLGGPSDEGTVFKLSAGTNVITTLGTFNIANGGRPIGDLIFDSAGNLYGTTQVAGGLNSYGTVFELTGSGFATPLPSSFALLATALLLLLAFSRFYRNPTAAN